MPSDSHLDQPAAVQPLVGLLQQLFDLLEILTDEEYTRKPVGVVESSIGGHIRHNLDHIQALLRGLPMGRVCYDHRDRGTNVESDRTAALDAILRVERELRDFCWKRVPRTILLSALVTPDAPPILVATSAERELAFVIGHTIHHNALIRVMVKLLGVDAPADFGYAPSTISHRKAQSCAR